MAYDYDVLIVGGGLTGLSLASALRETPLRIAIIDSAISQPAGNRSIALSYGSQQIFDRQGLWEKLLPAATPVRHVHVSDRGHFGITHFTAQKARVPALGYVLPMHVLQEVLQNALTIDVICPASVETMSPYEQGWSVDLHTPQGRRTLSAALIVAADGANSTIRRLQEMNVTEQHYHQIAMVANVQLARSHQNTAYERFTSNGAIALLPLPGDICALIWTVPEHAYLVRSDEDFLEALQTEFGYRLGRFVGVSPRHTHILKQLYVSDQIKAGLVLLGNAAHTLHPIAAQGFNLGLRDIACLAETIKRNVQKKRTLGDLQSLQAYMARRLTDQKRVMRFTDGLTKLFSNDGLLTYPRNLGLSLLDIMPFVKKQLLEQFAGV